jgi:hypothetical protein
LDILAIREREESLFPEIFRRGLAEPAIKRECGEQSAQPTENSRTYRFTHAPESPRISAANQKYGVEGDEALEIAA